MSYKRHEENKRKIGQQEGYLHAARRLQISLAHSMNARKCVHAKKPYSFQAFAHESRLEEEEKDRKDRGEEAYGKKVSPTKQLQTIRTISKVF